MINQNERAESSVSDNTDLNYRGYLTRRFKKTGRSISFRVGESVGDDKGTGCLNSTHSKHDEEGNMLKDTTDQLKEMNRHSNSISSSLTYTEPITSKLHPSVGYEDNSS